jgi:hypothetical protein
MTTIFYLMTLIFMGYEIWSIIHPNSFADTSYGIKQYTEDKAITAELMNGCVIALVTGLYILWAMAGLFSSNAKWFLLLLAIGFFSISLRKLFPKQSSIIMGIDAFLSVIILCVIFINHFI